MITVRQCALLVLYHWLRFTAEDVCVLECGRHQSTLVRLIACASITMWMLVHAETPAMSLDTMHGMTAEEYECLYRTTSHHKTISGSLDPVTVMQPISVIIHGDA